MKIRVNTLTIKENLNEIKGKIETACKNSNRNPDEITIVAVTKYVSETTAKSVLEAGIKHLGENRDQPFLSKYEAIGTEATWHFIGSLQSRKVKNIINKVDYIHSLDRLSLAKEINKRTDKPIKCFVQVNVSGEEQKHGLSANEVLPFIKELQQFEKIIVVGLMTMAPHTDDEQLIRSVFKRLKEIQEEAMDLNLANAPCNELSMGMSNDFTIAVEEGATFIRLGSSLVGSE